MANQVTVTDNAPSLVLGALLAPTAQVWSSIGRLVDRLLASVTTPQVIAIRPQTGGGFKIFEGLDASTDWDALQTGGTTFKIASTLPLGNTKTYEFDIIEQDGSTIGAIDLNPDTGTEQSLQDFLNRYFDKKWDSDTAGYYDTMIIDQVSGEIWCMDADAFNEVSLDSAWTNGGESGTLTVAGDKWE